MYPAGQLVQVELPAVAYEPAVQVTGEAGFAHDLPARHGEHIDARAAENEPAEHGTGADDPAGHAEPAGQEVQEVDPAAE